MSEPTPTPAPLPSFVIPVKTSITDLEAEAQRLISLGYVPVGGVFNVGSYAPPFGGLGIPMIIPSQK